MSSEARGTEKIVHVRYPASADARGSTRVNYLRRPYYLGPHDSPQSYIMFGLWKHRLLQSGKPPKSRDLRPLVDELLAKEENAPKRRVIPGYALSAGLAIVSLLIGIGLSPMIFSIKNVPVVDGMKLSEEEIAFVRGYRFTNSLALDHPLTDATRVAAKTRTLMDGDSENDLLHTAKKIH